MEDEGDGVCKITDDQKFKSNCENPTEFNSYIVFLYLVDINCQCNVSDQLLN